MRIAIARGAGVMRTVQMDHVQTVTRVKVGPLIATVSPLKMSEVRAALLFALGF